MRIKTTKQMRLDELIKYVWENDIKDKAFSSNFPEEVHRNKLYVHPDASVTIGLSGGNRVDKSLIYTVDVEEELTEETEFKELHEYFWDLEVGLGITEIRTNNSIAGILEEHDEESVSLSIAVRRRADNEPTLIWSKDTGIPKEGVIEA